MGEVTRGGNEADRHHIAPFESTPIVIDGVLYFSPPSNRVIALDAESGREIWQFDPQAGRAGTRQFFQYATPRGWENLRDFARPAFRSKFQNSRPPSPASAVTPMEGGEQLRAREKRGW